MSPRVHLRDDYLESRLIRRRLVLSAVFIFVLITLVAKGAIRTLRVKDVISVACFANQLSVFPGKGKL